MLRLLECLLSRPHRFDAYYCVLWFPDSTERRKFTNLPTRGMRTRPERRKFRKLPTRGMRIRSNGWASDPGQVWVVDEVVQSGRNTYTVYCVDRREYLEQLRRRTLYPDLGAELLELVRHMRTPVSDWRR